MLTTATTAALLASAPENHTKRCALVRQAIDDRRWSQAAVALRLAALSASEWAKDANDLATQCTSEQVSGRLASVIPYSHRSSATPNTLTLEALEAGLPVVANTVSRDCALRARRAMDGVMAGCSPAGAWDASPALDHPAPGAQA